ncbi:hypothetical protein [Pelomonas sp. KK5]|uniref:hypothetical protein n=1 Tax=Pelomonas sp. KK5 TaxID=1855730 RepID=UPI00097BB8F8|nr:hypothetical protein [Pelomonas sp. KK5]
MIRLTLPPLLLALLAFGSAHAQLGGPSMKDTIVAGGMQSGRTYQVAQHCGASADTLKAYKARFDADTKGGEATYASLGINIEQVFAAGRKEGDAFYDTIKGRPNRDSICSQTLDLVKSLSGKT